MVPYKTVYRKISVTWFYICICLYTYLYLSLHHNLPYNTYVTGYPTTERGGTVDGRRRRQIPCEDGDRLPPARLPATKKGKVKQRDEAGKKTKKEKVENF